MEKSSSKSREKKLKIQKRVRTCKLLYDCTIRIPNNGILNSTNMINFLARPSLDI
jgi:hypothetical protein